jgi:hypothetical protein
MIEKLQEVLRAALAEAKTAPDIFVQVIDELVVFNSMSIEEQERFANALITKWVLSGQRGRKLPPKPKKKRAKKQTKQNHQRTKAAISKLLEP